MRSHNNLLIRCDLSGHSAKLADRQWMQMSLRLLNRKHKRA